MQLITLFTTSILIQEVLYSQIVLNSDSLNNQPESENGRGRNCYLQQIELILVVENKLATQIQAESIDLVHLELTSRLSQNLSKMINYYEQIVMG